MSEAKKTLEGFNAGYILKEHRPELSKQLENSLGDIELPFFKGFVAGSKEFIKEQTKSKNISRLMKTIKTNMPKSKGRDGKGIDMDI